MSGKGNIPAWRWIVLTLTVVIMLHETFWTKDLLCLHQRTDAPPAALLELQQHLNNAQRFDDRHRGLRAPLRIGIIDDASITPTSRESLIGAKFQVVVKYQKVKELPGKYKYLLKPHLDANRTVVLVPEFYDGSYANLQAIGDGAFDSYLNKFIDEWKADGNRAMWIRPMHEFNGDWYSWGTYRSGNDRAKFQRAYKHVAYVFKNRGAQARMQLSYNCDNARGENRNFTEWFPGTDVVDMVLCSGYNRAGTDSYHMSWKSFTDVFTPGYNRMAALSGGKPLGVAETSSTTWQSNSKPQWIKDAFYAVVNKFTRVEQL